jgi:hypothetical protein
MKRFSARGGLCAIGVLLLASAYPVQADDWLPISPEERAMTKDPGGSGSHAILLYRSVDTDDVNSVESHYYRIKVFTEEGKKYGNVEIAYVKGNTKIDDLKARTIRPDGSVLEFKGDVFDKVLVKARGFKVHTKTFSFPEVEVGTILEYRYNVRWDITQLYSPDWIVQDRLPTRQVVFRFKPYPDLALSWTYWLPAGKAPQEAKGKKIELLLENVPPFEEEDNIPPEKELKYRVNFFYFRRAPESPDKFWEEEGKDWHRAIEDFVGKRKAMEREVAQLVDPLDPPEARLRKIYSRVQQIRNLSYERERSDTERKREKLKENNNVEDVLKNGYGYRSQINRLFVALARAAGMEASVVRVSERDVQFFQKNLLDQRQLDGEVAVVKVGAEERYFDPATPHCPFGVLAWLRAGVPGIRPDKDGGVFVTTPRPRSDQAVVERKGTLRLDEQGTLRGQVEVSFVGLEAVTRRLQALETDEEGRRKSLEDEIKSWLPASAAVELGEITGWEGFDQPLRARVKLTIEGYALAAGRRTLLPLGVFQTNASHPFQNTRRVHPVYLRNPYREMDDLTIELPQGLQVETVPQPKQHAQKFGSYQVARGKVEKGVRLQRILSLDGYFYPVEYYGQLRSFFSQVRAGDEEQIVLQRGESAQQE